MTPIEGPQSQLVYSTEPVQPGQRQEFRAHTRTRFIVRALGVAAHLAALGHEVETHLDDDGRVMWTSPIVAERDAHRYRQTLNALDRGRRMRQQQQIGANAPKVTDHERR